MHISRMIPRDWIKRSFTHVLKAALEDLALVDH